MRSCLEMKLPKVEIELFLPVQFIRSINVVHKGFLIWSNDSTMKQEMELSKQEMESFLLLPSSLSFSLGSQYLAWCVVAQ